MGLKRLAFHREDLVAACDELEIPRIRNLGDITYSFRFRKELPESIQKTAPAGAEWIIVGSGIANYEFRLAAPGKVSPNPNLINLSIPDSTPEILKHYAAGRDEQALLARVRYNRLIDTFTGLTCYSVQNHLRTTVESIGQIEIDEFYVGIDRTGVNYVLPIQAKSPGDRFGIVQVIQDLTFCNLKYPEAICRPLAFMFVSTNEVAAIELAVVEEDEILRLSVVDERHYKLVSHTEISKDELISRKNGHLGLDFSSK
ncbi:MAG: endonuclease [Candidatus Saccharibacteria bacterium]|nr:endonuclease [Candidatus Saccharibacteria bacterium]